jgi:hypothetical protein
MARLSEYNYQMCVEICAEVANGKSIKSVLNSKEEYPTFQTWCNWKRTHNELFDLYMRSIQDKADSVEEEMEDIYKQVKDRKIDPSTGRLLIDTLKWKAAKYYPKMFGDKVDVTTNGKDIPGTTIDYSKLSVEALQEIDKASG